MGIQRIVIALAGALLAAGSARAGDVPAPSRPGLDYADAANWVCRPGGADCSFDLGSTRLGPEGPGEAEPSRPDAAAKADCFYVYPTVSESPGLIAEPGVTEAERRAVRQQVARLASVCRLFVPFYRQVTYSSMKPGFARPDREASSAAIDAVEGDVVAAWDHYAAHDNGGRPFVLIGHSQGANRLIGLIQKRIDGRPIQAQLLSAVLPGAFVTTPIGKPVGGTFKSIPPCRADGQTGCFLAFNAMRAETILPPEIKPDFPGQELVCTNPAALSGGEGELKPYLSTSGETIIPDLTAKQPPWMRDGSAIATPFVSPYGLYIAQCRTDAHGAFLVVSTRPAAADRRTGAVTGDWLMNGAPVPVMGLHLIDLNVVAGNLVEVVAGQTKAWSARHRR